MEEEIRKIKNKYPTGWRKTMENAFRGIGDGQSIYMMFKREDREELRENTERGIKMKMEQETQKNWGKIDKSSYCRDYSKCKTELGREKYWDERK